jgi:hypothetical protein
LVLVAQAAQVEMIRVLEMSETTLYFQLLHLRVVDEVETLQTEQQELAALVVELMLLVKQLEAVQLIKAMIQHLFIAAVELVQVLQTLNAAVVMV